MSEPPQAASANTAPNPKQPKNRRISRLLKFTRTIAMN